VGAKKSSFWTKKGFELLGDFEEEEAKRLISFLEKSGFHAIMEQREAFLLVFADPKAVELYEHNCSFHDYLKYGSTKKVSEATWNLYPYIPLEENDQDE
jgi:hypothetical protein